MLRAGTRSHQYDVERFQIPPRRCSRPVSRPNILWGWVGGGEAVWVLLRRPAAPGGLRRYPRDPGAFFRCGKASTRPVLGPGPPGRQNGRFATAGKPGAGLFWALGRRGPKPADFRLQQSWKQASSGPWAAGAPSWPIFDCREARTRPAGPPGAQNGRFSTAGKPEAGQFWALRRRGPKTAVFGLQGSQKQATSGPGPPGPQNGGFSTAGKPETGQFWTLGRRGPKMAFFRLQGSQKQASFRPWPARMPRNPRFSQGFAHPEARTPRFLRGFACSGLRKPRFLRGVHPENGQKPRVFEMRMPKTRAKWPFLESLLGTVETFIRRKC
jgi:hypothetical protein